MTLRRTPILVTEDGRRMGTITHVAEALGVSSSQVHTWTTRRVTNGCPEPDPDIRRHSTGHGEADWYDLDDWRVWRLFYDPQHGVQRRARSTDPGRGGPTAVARDLGVSNSRVTTWISRRDRNGCPKPGEDGLYSFAEWKDWLPGYMASLTPKGRLLPQATADGRGTTGVIARTLGVDVKLVRKWVSRRGTNGCPERDEDGLYVIATWERWHAEQQQRAYVRATRRRQSGAA